MKHNRKPQARRMTKFERETERRRKEMLGNIAGRVGRIPTSRVKIEVAAGMPRSWIRLMLPERRYRPTVQV